MESYTINCPVCGTEIHTGGDNTEIVCPKCGTSFSVSRPSGSGRADSVVLYEATQSVNSIQRRVETYRTDSLALFAEVHKNAANPFKRLLAGTDPFAMSDIHNNYFTILNKLVTELDESLSSIHDSAAKSELARKAVDSILYFPEGDIPFQAAFNFHADDVLCEPLLKHMNREDLESVHAVYCKPERRKKFYPNQEKLAEEMDSLLGIKTRKGFAKLFGSSK